MKLIIISAVKECKKDIGSILSSVGVYTFSLFESRGYQIEPKVNNLENWFATGTGTTEDVSIQACIRADLAYCCLNAINAYNAQLENEFKISAYVMNVEQKNVEL